MFPYAEPVIGTALEPMSGARHVVMTPTILAGPPGVGKTYFAESLARVLGLPFEIYQCTAISDAALAGTPRSGMNPEPSLPVSVVRAHRHASPVHRARSTRQSFLPGCTPWSAGAADGKLLAGSLS